MIETPEHVKHARMVAHRLRGIARALTWGSGLPARVEINRCTYGLRTPLDREVRRLAIDCYRERAENGEGAIGTLHRRAAEIDGGANENPWLREKAG